MAEEIVSATVGILLQNLIDFSKDEISLIRGLEEDADNLKATLTAIQSFLDDAQKKFIDDAAVKTWLNELEAVAFDADNVLDELNYRRLAEKMKKKVPSCFLSFSHYVIKRDMAIRVKKVNKKFKSISKRATRLGLERRLTDAVAAVPDAASETDSFTVDSIFIGRDDELSKIVEVLTARTEEAVSVLPIVGMGGLGKTTLARKVFHHEKIKNHFEKHIWVHVSQHFDVVGLLRKILLKVGKVEDESREGLLKKLQQALGDKTYMLVLDDVWNQDREMWTDFMNSLSGITCTKGNGIIVTTRSTNVGSIVKTLGEDHLNLLSNEVCWSIIKGKAFKGGDIPPGLETIGRSIAERCRGLPLAANVVGGVLRDKSYDEWLLIKEEWLTSDIVGENTNNISKILKLSFHHLSSPSLKKCFAYCSTFPKGDQIKRKQLIELWMAEGFLLPSRTSDMETVGNKFFNLLLQNSLLQVVDRDDYDNVECCSMHDLVHDLASSVLGFLVNDEGTYRARYILWEDESSRIPKDQAKWLRTLIYNGRSSNIVFSDFKSLHALTLMSYYARELPDSIRELIHLRSLDISDTVIRTLPESIGELYLLQTLRTCRVLEKLPSTLKYLFNLRHLYVGYNHGNLIDLPPQVGMLTSLQTFPYFKVRNEEGHRIVELRSLKNLKGELRIYNLEKVQDEEESMQANLIQKSGIVKLVLVWGAIRGDEINDENVLKGLQPHPNLKKLKISRFSGTSFPSWTLKMAVCLEGHWVQLHNLVEIKLENCYECEEIPSLGHLPRLKSLCFSGLESVKFIGSSFYGIDNFSSEDGTVSVFPALERLQLQSMRDLIQWEEVEIPSAGEVKVFPRLQYLEISNCSKLEELPNDLHTLHSLEELRIERCPNLKSVPPYSSARQSHSFKLLRTLSIQDCHQLTNFPWEMMSSLEKLELQGRTMMNIVECVSKLRNLTELAIEIVPQVIITSPAASLPSLQTLFIIHKNVSCSDSDSRDSVSRVADGILRLGSHSLRQLYLTGKEDWESLPDQLQHLTSLSKLDVFGLGIEELPEWFGNLSSLQTLTLSNCQRLKCLPSVEAMRCLANLTYLNIRQCPLLKRSGVERRSDDDDSEWPKISHILTIRLDGNFIQEGGRKTR